MVRNGITKTMRFFRGRIHCSGFDTHCSDLEVWKMNRQINLNGSHCATSLMKLCQPHFSFTSLPCRPIASLSLFSILCHLLLDNHAISNTLSVMAAPPPPLHPQSTIIIIIFFILCFFFSASSWKHKGNGAEYSVGECQHSVREAIYEAEYGVSSWATLWSDFF